MVSKTGIVEFLRYNIDRRGVDECWNWTGPKNRGYGRVSVDDQNFYAHRIVYAQVHPGSITWEAPKSRKEAGFIRHTCDNPSCCNPSHMILGTYQDNMRDKVDRGRSNIWWRGTTETPRAKLTENDVRTIRKIVADRRNGKGGPKNAQLCEQYGISIPSLKSVVARRTYRDIF